MKGSLVIQEIGSDYPSYKRSYVGIIAEDIIIRRNGDPIIKIFWLDSNEFMYYHKDKLDTESGNIRIISEATNESR